jgi:hypothetical protein
MTCLLFKFRADDEEATFNAVQCLDTVDSILEAVQDNPATLALLEPITQPMILKYALSLFVVCFSVVVRVMK